MKRLNLYFFGDSICFGQGVSLHKTWVARVGARLEAEYAPGGCRTLVQNHSINGNTTRMALERIAYDIQGKDIDILVVQFGMNDCNIWQTDQGRPRVSLESFGANLQEMIDRARAFAIPRVVLNTNHPSGRFAALPNSQTTYQANLVAYNQRVRQVALANAPYVTLADMETYVKAQLPEPESIVHLQPAPDLIHLNERGNDLYVQGFYPVLQQCIESLEAERTHV